MAVVAALLGASQVAMGFAIAEGWILPYAEALARYAPSAKNSGDVINRGLYLLAFGFATGVATDISYGIRKRSRTD